MIAIDEEFIEAEVYKQIPTKSGVMYLAKVSFIDIGLYISGITIRKSAKEPDDWWVQLPAYRSGSKWVTPFEADQSKPLWLALKDKSLAALQQYIGAEDVVVTDFDDTNPINLDDIPF